MRKLKVFLLLPLLSLPPRITADLRARFGDRSPGTPARGDLGWFIITLARRCLSAPRRLLTHSATAPEIHVIAAAADADTTSTAAPRTTAERAAGHDPGPPGVPARLAADDVDPRSTSSQMPKGVFANALVAC